MNRGRVWGIHKTTGGTVLRRLITTALVALTLSMTGCAALNPPLTQQCTLFGCKKTGNIVKELGGTIVIVGAISAALAGAARRMSK